MEEYFPNFRFSPRLPELPLHGIFGTRYKKIEIRLRRLDPALVRPGRVDVKEYIGFCTEPQLKKMFTRFYQTVSPDLPEKFARNVLAQSKNVSAAQIQGYFMRHKADSPNVVAENVKEIWEE